MPAISTIIAGIGLGVAAGSAALSYSQSKSNAESQKEYQNQALAEQQKQEQLRQQAMDLDSMRRRRGALRQSLAARAASDSTAVSQGAQFSSVLPGAFGSESGDAGNNIVGVNQSQELGTEMFASNSRLSGIYRSAAASSADAQSNMALYGGLSSLGGAMVTNSQTIGKIGTWAYGKMSA